MITWYCVILDSWALAPIQLLVLHTADSDHICWLLSQSKNKLTPSLFHLLTPTALVQEDFEGFDYSTAQTLSNQLLPIQQPQNNSTGAKPTIIGAVVGVVVILIMMIVIGVVGCVLYTRLNK